jgi:osmoprotectant transport system permease protein
MTPPPGALLAAAGPVIPTFGHASSCIVQNRQFCASWFFDNFSSRFEPRLIEHLELTAIAVGIGFALAAGLALAAHYLRPVEQPIGVVSALLYTIPSLALFQLLVPFTGLTWTTVEIALVAYTLVILFPNFVAGLDAAPDEVLEAARGMGLTRLQILLRVELPLAVPAVVAGLRIAVVSTIAIATIAAFLLPDGLGYPIFLALREPTPFKTEIYSAGLLAVGLALACDAVFVVLRRTLVPWERKGHP